MGSPQTPTEIEEERERRNRRDRTLLNLPNGEVRRQAELRKKRRERKIRELPLTEEEKANDAFVRRYESGPGAVAVELQVPENKNDLIEALSSLSAPVNVDLYGGAHMFRTDEEIACFVTGFMLHWDIVDDEEKEG